MECEGDLIACRPWLRLLGGCAPQTPCGPLPMQGSLWFTLNPVCLPVQTVAALAGWLRPPDPLRPLALSVQLLLYPELCSRPSAACMPKYVEIAHWKFLIVNALNPQSLTDRGSR